MGEIEQAVDAIRADLVEKTITEDRTARSAEHIMSLEPPDMARFVQLMHDLRTALGSPRRMLAASEIAVAFRARRWRALSERP